MGFDELDNLAAVAFKEQVIAFQANVVTGIRNLAALATDLAVLGRPIAVIGESLARLEVVVPACAMGGEVPLFLRFSLYAARKDGLCGAAHITQEDIGVIELSESARWFASRRPASPLRAPFAEPTASANVHGD